MSTTADSIISKEYANEAGITVLFKIKTDRGLVANVAPEISQTDYERRLQEIVVSPKGLKVVRKTKIVSQAKEGRKIRTTNTYLFECEAVYE
jgi:primosomal protein N''